MTNIMTKNNKIPDIRFKGFTDDWEKRKFENTFVGISNNTLSRSELNYHNGLAKNVHYGDVLIKFGELLDVKENEIPFITNNIFANKFRGSSLQDGDMIIADTAEDESAGKCTELINVEEENILSGLHTIPIRPITSFAPKYLGYYMNSSAYHNQLLSLMQGTKVLSVSKSALRKTSICYPKSQIEQSKIGSYFQELDKLISQKQAKYEKLQKLKKAMLEKMFPKNGSDLPEIRFKGFDGNWEEKTLGEISDVTKLAGFEFTKYIIYSETGSIVAIRGLNVKNKKIILNDVKYIDKSDFTKLNRSKLFVGDILFTYVGTVGELAVIPEDNKYYLAPNVARIRLRKKYDPYFMIQLIGRKKFYDSMILPLIATSSQPALSMQNIRKFVLKIPYIDEQQVISSYFKNLDELITLNQKELEKLKTIKKACLEKMFV
jgi:type I restriction enzyme S subunit